MLDTLLLRPSLHFTTLHPITLHSTSLHLSTLQSSHLNFTQLHFTTLSFGLTPFKFPKVLLEDIRMYSDWLRAGRSGDRIPVGGAKFSATVQTDPGAHPAPLYNGYRLFSGGKAAEA